MSHSKNTKRGYSLYVENWNPSAKKYINTCSICGKKGYRPTIEDEDFCNSLERRVIFKELKKTLGKMQIDDLGRCETCSKVQDNRG